ncbi:MAG: aminoacyl-tRNA hydrolase [Clostridia bacterium]|nr:aminoacyl-tRNA hydrolase [Clostridia bacterium]
MYLIVGLGNPESDYSKTRHNMGFNVINKISEKYGIEVNKNKFKGLIGNGIIEGEKVILLKPQTFMNLSGESIIEAMNFYKTKENELIVIYDDIDIEPGNIRIRRNGSAGTHNGMKSIVEHLKTENFIRVRVGIGKPKENIDMISHVIGHISEEDKKILEEGTNIAKNAVIEIIKNGIDFSMNKYNKKLIKKQD